MALTSFAPWRKKSDQDTADQSSTNAFNQDNSEAFGQSDNASGTSNLGPVLLPTVHPGGAETSLPVLRFGSSLTASGGASDSSHPDGGSPPPANAFVSVTGTAAISANGAAAHPSSAGATSGGLSSSSSGDLISTPGSGLVFNNTYDASCTSAYISCIQSAEYQLESLFTNSVTLNMTFKEANEGNNGLALGNNWPSWTTVSYSTLKSTLNLVTNDLLPSTDPNPAGGHDWYLPEAYGRMLGLSSNTPSTDDTVTLNSYYGWSYGQDVINGVTHELTEGGMGRVGGLGDQNGVWSTMDLFRDTATGGPDYTDGRDGQTTYFSSNGGLTTSAKGVPALSFNNEYNSDGSFNNGGDTADFTQQAVFGSTYTGETVSLTQTELDVMEALGWTLSLKQDVFTAASGDWETPTNWSAGSMPIEPQDVLIQGVSGATVTLDADVTVNSIATTSGSILEIGDSAPTTLIATNGTVLNTEDSSSVASGNLGEILVVTGSTLQIGNTFDNAGSLVVGYKGAGGGGYLDLNGTVTLNGGGTVTLGEASSGFNFGDIQNAASSGGLINVDNTITGGGLISLTSFDNQASGKVIASQSGTGAYWLSISAGTFTNEGAMTAELGRDAQFGPIRRHAIACQYRFGRCRRRR